MVKAAKDVYYDRSRSLVSNRTFGTIVLAWLQAQSLKYLPSLRWLTTYSTNDLIADLLAGMSF